MVMSKNRYCFLIDTMLFYGEVNVLVHENELVTLLNFFDIDVLAELIRLKRIKLHVRQNILGVSKVGNAGNDQYGIGFIDLKMKMLKVFCIEHIGKL